MRFRARAAWHELGRRLGPNWGEFVPVSPFIARLAMTSAAEGGQGGAYAQRLDKVIHGLRMGAARPPWHLDAVLVYEVHAKTDAKATPLALADLTIVGAYLVPSPRDRGQGFRPRSSSTCATAIPISSPTRSRRRTGSCGRPSLGREPAAACVDVKTEAVRELVPRVEKLAYDLRIKLTETREKR